MRAFSWRSMVGVGLIELLLIAGAAIGVGAAGYGLYRTTEQHQQLAVEQDHVSALVSNTLQAYASANDFATLDQANALSTGVFPRTMLDPSGTPRSSWGGTVEVTGMPLPTSEGGTRDRGFAITYAAVPTSACQPLVANAGPGFYQVTVQGTSVLSSTGQVNPTQAAALCDRPGGATVQFVYAKDADVGVDNAPELDNCVIPADQVQDIACPSGQVSSVAPYGPNGIHQQREASCPDPYGAPQWTAWHTVSSTCSPTCTTRLADATWTTKTGFSQATPCPSGQTSTSNQSGTQAATCGANPAWPVDPTWAPIVWTGGSCAPTCATRLATAAFQPNPQSQPKSCPAGQVSTVNDTRSASCANPSAAADPTWSPWAGGSCAPTCATTLATAAWATQTSSRATSCPAGQLSTSNQTGTLSASCANPNTASSPTWGTWQWSGGSCAPACVVPASQTQSVACPAGQVGSVTQRRDASCPAPTGSAVWGGWYTTGSSCQPAMPPLTTACAALAPGPAPGVVNYSGGSCATSGGPSRLTNPPNVGFSVEIGDFWGSSSTGTYLGINNYGNYDVQGTDSYGQSCSPVFFPLTFNPGETRGTLLCFFNVPIGATSDTATIRVTYRPTGASATYTISGSFPNNHW